MVNLKGVVTLVTGGASGLGRGTVERFAKHGAKVIIGDLPSSKGNELAKELGPEVIFSPLDVSQTFYFITIEYYWIFPVAIVLS